MSEIPIQINFTSGLVANRALAMARTALLSTQRKCTGVQHHKIAELRNIGALNKTQRPPLEAISLPGKVFGLIDLKNKYFCLEITGRDNILPGRKP
jgi:hypothetical protein